MTICNIQLEHFWVSYYKNSERYTMLIVYLSLLSEETSKINASGHFTGSFINAVPPNDTYH